MNKVGDGKMTTVSLHNSRQFLLSNVLRSSAHNTPTKVCVDVEGETYTFAQLEQRAEQVAGWLQQQGLQQDGKVGYIFKNSMTFIELLWGVTFAGAISVPINFRLSSEEFKYILNDADVEYLFIGEEFIPVIEAIQEELPQVKKIIVASAHKHATFETYNAIFAQQNVYTPVKQNDDDACVIMYTSGTTGRPKGAVLTHKNIVTNAQNMIRDFEISSDLQNLIVAPLFHIAAFACVVFTTLIRGTAVIHKEFVPPAILQTIEQKKINLMFLVPAMWNFITSMPNLQDYDLSSMKKCISGAETIPVTVKQKIIDTFKVDGLIEVFGQTETSPVTLLMRPKDSLVKIAALGQPIVNIEVRIVDENMNDVPLGEVGEIVYRGPTVMKEYYKKPEETEKAFEGGWFHSGDLVSMDEDGFISIRDRKKDMIISAGENIYPAEIENVLYKHEAIFEAAVIGVPDEKWGEAVKAFIVLKEGQQLTEQQVIDYCVANLASYKKPKYVEFINALPRNTSGKILKTTLRATVQTS